GDRKAIGHRGRHRHVVPARRRRALVHDEGNIIHRDWAGEEGEVDVEVEVERNPRGRQAVVQLEVKPLGGHPSGCTTPLGH
uniref:Uncharacterized protein n=1 Tax=Triticum urartu TaxID=4572 RepID=A0A8R7QKC0_TRIUA